jgi:rubrerythrin
MILNKFPIEKTRSELLSDGKKDEEKKAVANKPVKENYRYDATTDKTEILWKCLVCGELKQRNEWVLDKCPACSAPKSQFVLVDED